MYTWLVSQNRPDPKGDAKPIKESLSGPPSVTASADAKPKLDVLARSIIQMARPMVELSMLLLDNVHVLERQLGDLVSHNIEALKEKLYVPIVDLELEPLKHPATVCTETACAEMYQLETGRKEWHYKTRCHQPCHLRNVPQEVIGSAELKGCAVMSPAGTCNGCGHGYKSHMHVHYVSKLIETNKTDPVVMRDLQTHEQVLDYSKKIVREIEERQRQLQTELEALVESNATFSHFLAAKSSRDVYEGYLQCLLDRERDLDAQGDALKLVQLQRLLDDHRNAKNRLLSEPDRNVETIVEDIVCRIHGLYRLTISGPKIKQLFRLQNRDLKSKPKLAKAANATEANKSATEGNAPVSTDNATEQTNESSNPDASPFDFERVSSKVMSDGAEAGEFDATVDKVEEESDGNTKYWNTKCPLMGLMYWKCPPINLMAIALFSCLNTYSFVQIVLIPCLILVNVCMVISANDICKIQMSRLSLNNQIQRLSEFAAMHSNLVANRLLNIVAVENLANTLKFNAVLWMLLLTDIWYKGTSLFSTFFVVLSIVPILCEWIHVDLRYLEIHYNVPDVLKKLKRYLDGLMVHLMDY